MKRLENRTEKIIKRAVSTLVEAETREWPPKCITFMYQPKRPSKNLSIQDAHKSTK